MVFKRIGIFEVEGKSRFHHLVRRRSCVFSLEKSLLCRTDWITLQLAAERPYYGTLNQCAYMKLLSMLAIPSSSVIENVIAFCDQKPAARAYAYFFFDGTRALSETLNYDGLTRSIIMQLADRCGDRVPAALVQMYDACDRGHRQPSKAALEETLSRILKIFDSTYIVIDSLDECVTKGDLLAWLRSIAAGTTPGNIHLLLTSRPEPEVQHALTSLSNLQKVSIGDHCNAEDIDIYLDARLQAAEMDRWSQSEKQEIKKTLAKGSSGM